MTTSTLYAGTTIQFLTPETRLFEQALLRSKKLNCRLLNTDIAHEKLYYQEIQEQRAFLSRSYGWRLLFAIAEINVLSET